MRRARRIDRPPAPEVFALVMDRMHLGSVGKHWRIAIKDNGIGLPCLPQPRDYVGELIGDVVSFIVRVLLVSAIVLSGAIVAASHAVPTHSAFGDMVE